MSINIQQESLYHFLQGDVIKTEYFYHEDYKVICDKSLAYKNKNKTLPSVNFLLEYVNKLSDDKEVVDRIEDLLYVASKYKPELNTINEVNELLLENFKKESIRDYTKALAKNLTEGNEGRVQYYADKISEINKLQLNGEDFRKNDVKKDIQATDIKVELIPSGFPETAHESLSKVGRGQVISLISDTGEGKSISMINAVVNQYLNGFDTIYISYEMPKKTVLARMLSSICEVPISEINSGNFTTDEAELRLNAGRAVLQYDISFDKAFTRVLKGKDFEDCKLRENYLKILAITSVGEDGITELPDSEGLLQLLDEYKPDFMTVDLISEVRITKSAGSYETDLANLARDFNAKALATGAVVYLVSQPAGSSFPSIIYPKYCKAIRSSSSSNIIISSTNEMKKDNISVFVVEKCRHSERGHCIPMNKEFQYMRFTHLESESDLKMEEYFNELNKTIKVKDK